MARYGVNNETDPTASTISRNEQGYISQEADVLKLLFRPLSNVNEAEIKISPAAVKEVIR